MVDNIPPHIALPLAAVAWLVLAVLKIRERNR